MKFNKSSKIYIAGHQGMVGSACWRILKKFGYSNLIGKTSKGHKYNPNYESEYKKVRSYYICY